MDIVSELERTRSETLACFSYDAELLGRRHGSKTWDVRHLLHHLADAETVLFDRIRRVHSNPSQVIWAFDQEAWAESLDYANRPLQLSLDLYLSTRSGIIYYASREYLRSDSITFVHSETGLRTLADEFEKVVLHNQHHLDQIARAIKT